MENLNATGFVIDGWQISPAEGVLTRANETERLEPKVMDVLVYLASHPGEVVSREELESAVWRGALVGYDAVTATVIKLRKALQDDAREPRIIATIPKKGYQLIAPVSLPGNNLPAETNTTSLPEKSNYITDSGTPASLNKKVTVGIALIIFVAIGWLSMSQLNQPSSVASTSLLVLPFENLGSNQEYEVFVDGITEDIITDLSRLLNLMVFASNTTFKYKNQKISPQELHKDLKVNYVLKGNARRAGEDIRINVQLINAETGFNIWAQRYDRKTREVFAVQDEITSSLIEALSIKLSSQEKQLLSQRATNNLEAYEYFLEGQRLARIYAQDTNRQALESYRQAIQIDSGYGRVYGAMAYVLSQDYRSGWTDTPQETLDRALALAEQGVQLDSSNPYTHWSLGFVHMRRKESEKAEKAVSEAIRIAPNFADGYGLLALIHNNLGNAEKALDYATRGMQLNPYYTWDYLANAGFAHYLLGNYSQAIDLLEKAQARNENAISVKQFLAISYVRAGRLEDARWTIDQLQILNPEATLSHNNNASSIANPELKQMILDDLRKAGMPDE